MTCTVRHISFCAWLLVATQFHSTATAADAELPLRYDPIVKTPQGREVLKYIVSCSLPLGMSVGFSHAGERYSLPGELGIAPAWSSRALNEKEERRVSGCVMARTNYFGKRVVLSMRSTSSDAGTSLTADSAERDAYPFFEAAYFGNLFAENPVGYVCTGDSRANRQAHLESLLRVCSLPGTQAKAQPGLSRCGFKIVGPCEGQAKLQDGIDYSDEAIEVYLPGPK
jgi:hypothetical protein